MAVLSAMLAHSTEAYLLAAMPQSSSTAAMESLGRMSCRNAISPPDSDQACSRCKQQRPPEPNQWQTHFQPPPDCRTDPVWRQLERQHSHVCQLPDMLLQRYASDNATIYKDHVLPTPRSIAALRAARWPVLVMLREPAGSLHGWCEKKRHEQRQVGLCASALQNAHGMNTAYTRHKHGTHTGFVCPRHAHGMSTACALHAQVDVREAHERLEGLEAFDAGWREAAARHSDRFEIVTHEALQGAGRGVALTAAQRRAWPQLRTCAAFQDSDARWLNASTPFCSRLVDTVRAIRADAEAGCRNGSMSSAVSSG